MKYHLTDLNHTFPDLKFISYSWDFGDKTQSQRREGYPFFTEKGEYMVNLELALRSDSTGHIKKTGISKKIIIFNDDQEGTAYLAKGVYCEKRHT